MRILMIFLCIIFVLNLSATIINIPAEQPTIQAGIYFYKLKTENYEKTKRMVLLK